MANQDITDPIEEKDEVVTKEIDLVEIARTLWRRKKTLGIWCAVGAFLGLVIAFSIPKEYKTEVKLAPEEIDTKNGGSFGNLAAMAGINIGASTTDAVYPNLYPDVIKSVPFCVSLFNVPLSDKEGTRQFILRDYMKDDIKSPWWKFLLSLPGKAIGALKSGGKQDKENAEADPFRLTTKESALVAALNARIMATVDQKTDVITVSVEMQDPVVSAVLADTVVNRLREYITDYRTNKARKDLEYIEQLNEESRASYYAAQQRFADYLDSHQGVMTYSARTMRDRLENEATLAFNMYNTTSQQLQRAKAKVQEVTPVYTIISPPTVPVKASSPKKLLILAGCVFLAFVACAAWILFIRPETVALGEVGNDEKGDDDARTADK